MSFFPAVNGILARPSFISNASATLTTPASIVNFGFVSVYGVKSFCRYYGPLLVPIYARQKSRYDLSGERDAEDLMVLSVGDHSQVMQHRPKKNNNLSIIIGQLMIRNDTRFHTGLDQVSENLQANVRHYCEMNSPMI